MTLVTIFYDYFDNSVLVERAKKNIKFTLMTEQKEGNFVSSSFFLCSLSVALRQNLKSKRNPKSKNT